MSTEGQKALDPKTVANEAVETHNSLDRQVNFFWEKLRKEVPQAALSNPVVCEILSTGIRHYLHQARNWLNHRNGKKAQAKSEQKAKQQSEEDKERERQERGFVLVDYPIQRQMPDGRLFPQWTFEELEPERDKAGKEFKGCAYVFCLYDEFMGIEADPDERIGIAVPPEKATRLVKKAKLRARKLQDKL